jgi:HlyD family secretion protein
MRTASLVTAIAAAGGGGLAYVSRADTAPAVSTALVSRGTIVETISATGTIEATTTVEVGSQVSGAVKELLADFNQFVSRGDVLARLDPALFATQVEQARANVIRAEADVERLRVSLANADSNLKRSTMLAAKQLLSVNDLESADVSVRLAAAQVKSAEAALTQARASLNQAQVNLEHTVITSPIDGIVLSRNVDVGQTVAASMQAPVLFKLAADLNRMRVSASLDESDVGRVAVGQPVSFRVDAYPEQTFAGTVSQVRLQPVVSQNVVTYVTMIDCLNPGAQLKPGMTASVTIEVARRTDVPTVPAAALRFKPSAEVAAAFGVQAGAAPSGRARAAGAAPATALWVLDAGALRAVPVTTGISDGTTTEVVTGAPGPGTTVVTAIRLDASTSGTAATATTRSPLAMTPGPPPR